MEDYIIEGISHETFFAVCFTLFAAFFLLMGITTCFSRRRSAGNQRIHPHSRENVETIRGQVRHDGDANTERPRNNEQDQCPICMDNLHLATETNCGHLFCAPCIIAYWNHGFGLNSMSCPICRQMVSIIFCNFTEDEINTNEAGQLSGQISAYNRRFSGQPRTIMEYITDFPVLLRHMIGQLFTPDGMLWMFRFRVMLYMALVLIYVILPFDLLPESIVGFFGFVDDLIILLVVLVYLTVIYRAYVSQQ